VNRKEAEIVRLTFELYLMNVGTSRIGRLLDYRDYIRVKYFHETPIKYHEFLLNPLTEEDLIMYNTLVKLCVYVRWCKW
jgi:hypothetical protein